MPVERIGAGQTQTVYVFADRLSSASLVTTTQGEQIADQRYLPFGEERWNAVDLPNDRGYTGQRNEKHNTHYVVQGFGLMDYNARFYSAYLGRFVSADSVIGNIDKTQDFDRYSYSINNPILFNDPSGHHYCESRFADPSECQGITFEEMYNIRWLNKWPAMEKQAAEKGVKEISKRLQPRTGFSPAESFNAVFGYMEFEWNPKCKDCRPIDCGSDYSGRCEPVGGYTYSAHWIVMARSWSDPTNFKFNILHELGHAFDLRLDCEPRAKLSNAMETGKHPTDRIGYAGGFNKWQQSEDGTYPEQFADNFIGWLYGEWSKDFAEGIHRAAQQRTEFMDLYMPAWIKQLMSSGGK